MELNRGQFFLYGFNREPKVRRFIYSVLMSALYFLAIGIPLLLGYMIRVVSNRSEGKNIESPPEFRPLLPLFKQGLVVVTYALIMIGIPSSIITGVNFAVDRFIGSSDQIGLATAVGINVSLAVTFLILVLGTFLFIPMMIRYVRNGNWKSGYKIGDLSSIVYSKKYILLYVKFMIFSILAGYITVTLFQTVLLAPIGGISWFIYMTGIGVMIGDFMRHESSNRSSADTTEE